MGTGKPASMLRALSPALMKPHGGKVYRGVPEAPLLKRMPSRLVAFLEPLGAFLELIIEKKLWIFEYDREMMAAAKIIIDLRFIVHVVLGIT